MNPLGRNEEDMNEVNGDYVIECVGMTTITDVKTRKENKENKQLIN